MADKKYEQMDLFELDRPVIKGYPELRWTGKRPYTSTQFFPAQLKERYGEADDSGWINKIFWGDNLQVMSHLLKEYRGKIDLIYIDPPFDSKADYKKTIKVRGKQIRNDNNTFEEKQYGDIWTNDEYLQFMYERFVLLRELLSDKGSILVHCDWHKSHHLRMLLDEIFGNGGSDGKGPGFKNEIIWAYRIQGVGKGTWARKHDTILFYTKTSEYVFNVEKEDVIYNSKFIDTMCESPDLNSLTNSDLEKIRKCLEERVPFPDSLKSKLFNKYYSNVYVRDVWDCDYTKPIISGSSEYLQYPTQKPEGLLTRIINAHSNVGDLVFDCFMGSGTTQAVALKLKRRFLGADINLGSIQTATKRLNNIIINNNNQGLLAEKITGFEVYNVNNYDFFRNPIEARDLLIEALSIQKFSAANVFDGELDGRHVKILPVNRIATKSDLKELVANLPYKAYDKAKEEYPNDPVDRITLVCMGHEPDLKASLQQMIGVYKVDIEVVDILKDKTTLEFKRDAQAEVVLKGHDVVIKNFYPMNLLQKLSIQKENVEDWKQLVDSVMVDYNYDGNTLNPQIIDIPEKNDLVKGKYNIPANHGKIKVKITDLLSESLEVEVE